MITKPTLILDEKKCANNISNMILKATKHKLTFRPHFKTHQSKAIGNWFKEKGVQKITVSSVSMAKYFIESGWEDITIAFPFNILETNVVNNMHENINLNLLVESSYTIEYLENNLTKNCGIYIKVDTGYHRTGIESDNIEKIDFLISLIDRTNKLNFKGFLTHFGNTYDAVSLEEIKSIFKKSLDELLVLKNKYSTRYPEIEISIGDTPSVCIIDDFTGVDEIRPGNFIFYDAEQYQLGSCNFKDIAVSLACPIVAKNEQRTELTIYGGSVHLSKDYTIVNGVKNYGLVCLYKADKLEKPLKATFLKSLSQEHGIVSTTDKIFNSLNIGDIVHIIPSHSCLTANLAGKYLTMKGKTYDHLSSTYWHSV